MAITIDDFSKIWASTSPLTPYEFSENNYKQGWDFVGGTPPSRQMWDFLQKNNDEKMQYLADNYLPLSGGTMTGAISRSGTFVKNIDDTSAVLFNAGTDNSGSYIGMWAKNNTVSPGVIQLRCSDGINSTSLSCYPNGTLTWNGQNVEVVDSSLFSTGSGWIRYKNGLQICCDNATASNDGAVTVSFAKAFSAVPVIVLGRASVTVTTAIECAKTANRTTTGFDLLLTNGSYMSGQVSYIAIGKWI